MTYLKNNWIVRSALSYKQLTVTLFLATSILLMFPAGLHAQTGTIGGRPAYPEASNDRTKSIFIKTITPGSAASDAVEVINNSDEDKAILVYGADAVSSSGGAFACAQAVDTPKQAGKWVVLSQNLVTVKAGDKVIVPFTITVPNDAEPGEQNGCIVLQEKRGPVIQDGIGLSFRTAIRVAVLVPGAINKALDPLGILVTVTANKIVIAPKIKNTGNVSLDTKVDTSLQAIFGALQASEGNTFPVLRDQITEWNFEVDRPFWGGFYEASYSLSYDASDNFIGSASPKDIKVIQGPRAWVFVMPNTWALLIELAIISLVVIAILRYRLYIVRTWSVKKTWVEYTVTTADNLQMLAKKYAVSWRVLAKANNLKAPYILSEGQNIKVPGAKQQAQKRIVRKK